METSVITATIFNTPEARRGAFFAVGGFSTRLGGVSGDAERPWLSSLNLGYRRGDDAPNVDKNYRIVADALGVPQNSFIWNTQVHGNTVLKAGRSDLPLRFPRPKADAMITNEPGVTLTVFTADCVPILLFDPVSPAIGAVHAGWRGTANGIVAYTVSAMAREYGTNPGDIIAAIGPCIGKCCFETHADVPEAMQSGFGDGAVAMGKSALAFIEELGGGRYKVDIAGINRERLIRMGVPAHHIEMSIRCTCCESDLFWSYRKAGDKRGSQAGLIALSEAL